VEPLPVLAPSCSLDPVELSAQLERYRTVGAGAEVVERDRRRLVVRVAGVVPDAIVSELVAVERECCPFFGLEWAPAARRLVISVPTAAHEPALDAIGDALTLPPPPPGSGLDAPAPQRRGE
jgi:hypothetical protein